MEKQMIGDVIRAIREGAGLRQKDLAALVGVSSVAISNYERGTRSPSAEMLEKIAAVLDVNVEFIHYKAAELASVIPDGPVPPFRRSSSSMSYVNSESDLVEWRNQLLDSGSEDPDFLLIMMVIPRFLDQGSWVISTTIPEIAMRAALPVETVEEKWEQVLNSSFVERLGSGEWTLRLVFSADGSTGGRDSE